MKAAKRMRTVTLSGGTGIGLVPSEIVNLHHTTTRRKSKGQGPCLLGELLSGKVNCILSPGLEVDCRLGEHGTAVSPPQTRRGYRW